MRPMVNVIPSESPIFSLRDVVGLLKEVVEQTFSHLRVRAEVSGLKRHSSGHYYFTLKEEDIVLDAVCWRGNGGANRALLADGLEIIATGHLAIYGGRSRYQLVVQSFEPAGQGALLQLLLERKERLAAEGLFDRDRKKALPRFPQVIGVITSATGAVIQDILHRLRDRYPCRVLLWPVAVQGEGAAAAIATAIKGFQTCTPRPEVLIVARGGGSLEDLWAFNEENVVRAVAASEIPLVSAVGHETDTTLIDFAADIRAPTPTAAAELVTPVPINDLWLWAGERQQRLAATLLQTLERCKLRLDGLRSERLHPQRLLSERLQRLDEWTERWQRVCALSLERWNGRFANYTTRLEQASYKKTLERGFAWVTTLSGQTITTQAHIFPKQLLCLTFADGTTKVKVQANKPEKIRQVKEQLLFLREQENYHVTSPDHRKHS